MLSEDMVMLPHPSTRSCTPDPSTRCLMYAFSLQRATPIDLLQISTFGSCAQVPRESRMWRWHPCLWRRRWLLRVSERRDSSSALPLCGMNLPTGFWSGVEGVLIGEQCSVVCICVFRFQGIEQDNKDCCVMFLGMFLKYKADQRSKNARRTSRSACLLCSPPFSFVGAKVFAL